MSRRTAAAFVAGLVLATAVPVMADHTAVPTEPITGVRLKVFNYGTGEEVDCEGDQTNTRIDWNAVRIEGYVTADDTPSEHFKTFLQVWAGQLGAVAAWPDPGTNPVPSNRFKWRWNVQWNHSNIAPHGNKATTTGWRFMPITNEYFRDHDDGVGLEGTWAIRLLLVGDESGVVLEDRCVYERVSRLDG